MSKLKLIIFDCDGVMFDSLEANRQYYNAILAQFGHAAMDADELQYVHVHHVADSIRHIFRHYPEDYDKAEQYRASVDYTDYLPYMKMEEDLIDFLQYVRPERKTAISTNRSTTMPDLMRLSGLDPYYDMVVTPLDVEHPKPHPEALEKILAHFHMEAPEAIYIGDSYVDQEHAAAAGMRLIAFKNPDLTADFHVTSFMEILELDIFAER